MPLFAEAEAFVVVMNGHGEDLFGSILADHVLVEFVLEGAGRGDIGDGVFGNAAPAFFLVDDRLAQLDALTTDVHVAGALDEGADISIAFATERTKSIAVATGVAGWFTSARAHA